MLADLEIIIKRKGFIMSNDINRTKGFLIGFLAGGAAGAIAALLTTPKSGKELRGDIKHKSEEYFDEADKYITGAKNKAGKFITEGKRRYTMIMNDIKSKPEEMLNDTERIFKDAKIKTTEFLNFGKEETETESNKTKFSFKPGIDVRNKS
jgi:gas vesicle protein